MKKFPREQSGSAKRQKMAERRKLEKSGRLNASLIIFRKGNNKKQTERKPRKERLEVLKLKGTIEYPAK